MATWVNPIDSETDPDAPLTSNLGKRWDNNVIALAEGASGAPRIEDAALDTAVTTAGETWVQERMAASSAGDVGTWGLFRWTGASGTVTPGATVAGSILLYTNAVGTSSGISPSGTWRCMGYADDSSVAARTTVFMRVS